jgi:hypothetical protein
MRLVAAEVASKLALGDVADEADVGGSGLDRVAAVAGAEVASIPGATKQRRKLAGLAAEELKDGFELLYEEEEAAIGNGFVIAQHLEDGAGCGTGGEDAVEGPVRVRLGKEGGNLTPAGSLAGFAGFADEDDEEIEAVPGGAYEGVRGGSKEVAEGGEKLEQDGSWVGFGMWSEAADYLAGQAVESGAG